jgi:ribosomal protein L28
LPTKRSKKTIDTQNRILNYIYEKTRLKLNVDDWCNQIENIRGKRYFNVNLGEKQSWSSTFQKLKRLASYSQTIYNVEKNGTGVVAIYFV